MNNEFWQVTVIVNGAVDDEEYITGRQELHEYFSDLRMEAEEYGLEAEVYVIHHPHPVEIEDCACSQYQTDHHPTFVLPRDVNEMTRDRVACL